MPGAHVFPASSLADEDAIAALGDEPQAAPGSLLDRLRSRAAEQGKRTLDLPVPGRWRGELVLRFRPLDVGQLERFVENRQAGRVSGVSESIDALATCCVGVLGRDGDRLTELADERGPVRIEPRLAALLAMPGADDSFTAREVVLWLFDNNAFALGTYVDRMVEWMADPDASEPPGES